MAAHFLNFWSNFKFDGNSASHQFLFGPLAESPLLIGSVFGGHPEPLKVLYSGERIEITHDGSYFRWNGRGFSGRAEWFFGIPRIPHERALWQPHFYPKWAAYRRFADLQKHATQPKEFGVSMVASNFHVGNLAARRAALAHELSHFLPVHANREVQKTAPRDSKVIYHDVGKGLETKLQFLGRFSHNLCFENHSAPGYLTEKLFDAIVVGAVPLYTGDSHAHEWFRPESYIECKNLQASEVADVIHERSQLNEYVAATRERLCLVSFEEMHERTGDFHRKIIRSL